MFDVDPPASSSPHSSKTSFPSTSLNTTHILAAIQHSSDNGATLMFSKMNLTDVGVLAAEELATIGRATPEDDSPVKRIALGNNRLTTLPTEFALLSRLRYLNLKHNSFSVFPDVLTLMPSLDTLDISHNKIKRFPTQAGQLVQLRVFCLSRNKVTRLPPYLAQFQNLEVLQVDRNPIEWPLKSVVEHARNLEPGQHMKDWIKSLQIWMETHTPSSKTRDDIIYNEQQDLDNHLEESYNSWKFPIQENEFDAGHTPHVRSISVDSNISMSSIAESLQEFDPPSPMYAADRPPPLHLGILQSYSSEASPTRSLASYPPSPVDTEAFHDDSILSGLNRLDPQHHTRNASYAGGLSSPNRSELSEKKSMPDLRTAKLNFSRKVSTLPHPGSSTTPLMNDKDHDSFSIPSPIPYRQDSGSSFGSTSQLPRLHSSDTNQTSPTRSAPSMAFERNSYFRRLSTLPSSSSLPKPLLCLIDSARSILFAVCQVYQALEHYMVYAIDDRLSSVLKKVLDPASTDMMQLINSLDRFDAMSRKTLPPPAVCRGVVESCRDTVAVFGKAVSVLGLQLKVIATGDDVRYSRWILLELYAASAEISSAWQAMVPNIEAIKPLLRAKTFSISIPGGESSEVHTALISQTSGQTETPLSLRPHPVGLGPASGGGRVRTARRHAGSFSSKDVEIGKKLPSYDDVPGMFGGVVSGIALHTPTLRAPKRQTTLPLSASSSFANPAPLASTSTFTSHSTVADGFRTNHSRQGSQVSLQASTSSSPSIPSKTTFLELPSNSKTQVDKEAVQAVQAAVEVAPKVWDMMEDLLGNVLDAKNTVRETLERARAVTTRLSETIRVMQETDSAGDRKLLREDAHIFLKTVVQLSNLIKKHGGPHTVSPTLRTNMVKLTNSTEEFAILLHVSSFSPSIPRSYSPMLSLSIASPGPSTSDENRLGANLSRSRSARPSESFKLPPLPSHDMPRSALPTQSFKVPVIRRLRGREARVDITDPG